MRAIYWNGMNRLEVGNVSDPELIHPKDIIVQVSLSSVCGSDLQMLKGQMPLMRRGDVLGHEFMGEVVEVGPEVRALRIGDRVVVPSVVVCGSCFYCQKEEWSICDNTNANDDLLTQRFGDSPAGIYGEAQALGGYPGSHAELIRVPFGDVNSFKVPDSISDEQAVFVSDAVPTGFMGADLCGIMPGHVVAVWGCGGVGQMAIQSAFLLGASRVIAIDSVPERLRFAREHAHAETVNYQDVDVLSALREMTAGRGPDACIDAVGMDAYGIGYSSLFDRLSQFAGRETDSNSVLSEMILACRKGGTISIMGNYRGIVNKIPMGAAMNKALTFKMGRQRGHKYIPRLLQLIHEGRLDPSYLMTHCLSLEEGIQGYRIFKQRRDHVIRVVFAPQKNRNAA